MGTSIYANVVKDKFITQLHSSTHRDIHLMAEIMACFQTESTIIDACKDTLETAILEGKVNNASKVVMDFLEECLDVLMNDNEAGSILITMSY